MKHKEYIRHTSGNTAVLFIHGFLGSPNHFRPFLELVPENFGIYNVLLHGHGRTVKDFSNASMKNWKEQVENIVLQLSEKYDKIIIAAHSMGTLFAYSMAIKYPDKIKTLYLLGTPLVIGVRGTAFLNSMKALFGKISEDDEKGKAYADSHGIKLNLKLWQYIGWIPRYLELFSESKSWRSGICNVNTPCYIFQSAKDELVSAKSLRYIPKKDNITLTVLEKSAHFIYDKDDMSVLCEKFKEVLRT